MACEKALERLKEKKESDRECIKYKICPDCGGSLVTLTVMDVSETFCTTCGSKFNSRGRGSHRGPHPEGG